MTQRREISPRTAVELLVAPSLDLSESGPIAWQVLKPVDGSYIGTNVDLTPAVLEEVAASYDPNIDQAPINIDHQRSGAALGWIRRVWTENGLLFAEPMDLSEELSDGIRSKKFKRVSAELDRNHPETGGWYLSGLAVLGARKPKIKGLKHIHLSEATRFRIQTEEEMPLKPKAENPQPESQTPAEETVVVELSQPAPLDLSQPVNLGNGQVITLAEILSDRAEVTRKAQQFDEALGRLHLSEATSRIDKGLDELGEQINLKTRRVLRPVLLALASSGQDGQHQTLELSETDDDGETHKVTVTAVDAVLGALKHLPAIELAGDVGSTFLAGPESDESSRSPRDPRTAAERQLHLSEGLTDERYQQLADKYDFN